MSNPAPTLAEVHPPSRLSREVAVRIRGVTKGFGAGDQRVLALRGVDWEVHAGQISLIVGPSGCGKTTLLSVIAGILDCDAGQVDVFGTPVSTMRDRDKTRFRAKNIGFVFQQYNLLPALTAAENAAIPLVIAGWTKEKAVDRARAVLQSLGMGGRTENLPSQLSGGQQQRVAIARALVNDPKVILADEPTGQLDSRASMELMRLLQELVHAGITIVLVTHESDIGRCAERVITMRDGKIISDAVQVPAKAAA